MDAAYGPLFAWTPFGEDGQLPLTIRDLVRTVPAGVRYVLCVLKPARELRVDRHDLELAVQGLTGGDVALPLHDYMVVGGTARERPVLVENADRPFHRRATIGGVAVEIRMDAWLSVDTIRRMGFGHVITARHHALIVERGVSLVSFAADGRPLRTTYLASIFAPEQRFAVQPHVMVE
jgi:hypothetical protein